RGLSPATSSRVWVHLPFSVSDVMRTCINPAIGVQQSALTKELEYIFIVVWMPIFAIAFSKTSLPAQRTCLDSAKFAQSVAPFLRSSAHPIQFRNVSAHLHYCSSGR